MHSGPPTLARFYREHNGWLQGLLHRQSGCPELASDLVQDTFVRLLRRREDVNAIEQPRAYLGRIARGLLANHWRRQDIERAYLDALQHHPQAREISAEEHHVILETLGQIDDMLRNLPARVRQAFLMSRLERMTYRQIGTALGVSERMVKKYMAQAMFQCLLLAQADHA